ncbi:MAG: right-handed parallel beta-helix repeat-containing protein [Candidatus Paceibacterota bacterium]|jgi:hypothetical protein
MRLQKIVLLFLFIFFVSFSPKVFAFTSVDSDITENTTWTLDQSPYVVTTPIVVAADFALTIEPGVVVKFDFGGSLIVDGAINASGTSIEPIYFTSLRDDSVGGDTNEDGGDSFPDEGDWDCIFMESSTGQSILNNVNIKYSGDELILYNNNFVSSDALSSNKGIFVLGSHGSFTNLTVPGIEAINGSEISIDTATISTTDVSSDYLISVYNNSSLSIKSVKMVSPGLFYAILVFTNSSAVLDSVEVSGDILSGTAVAAYNGSSLSVKNSSFSNHENGLAVYNDSSVDILNSHIECSNDGVSLFGEAGATISNTEISCGNDGVVIFNEAKVNIDNIKVSGATDAGIVAFNNFNPGAILVTKSEISENGNGFVVFKTNITAHENSIHDNYISGVTSFAPLDPNQFDFTSNFWGDASGPNSLSNPGGLGDIISGDVSFTPWCKNQSCLTHNPIIIVPGVLGTEINKPIEGGLEKLWLDLVHNLMDIGDEFMDPLQFNFDLTPSDMSLVVGNVIGQVLSFDYTKGLVEEFQNQGYVEGTDLFLFPYDWRFGVSEENVNKLKQKITDVLIQSGADKVDVIAHSTGGLLVKRYVMENPSEHYIDKTVFVGVPNTGAPKAVKALIQGDSFGNFLVADSEMKKISKNMPVAYDLLPSEQYYNVKGSYVEILDESGILYTSHDLSYEDMNDFLTADHGLSAQALINAQNLHIPDFDNYDIRTSGVDLYAIDGCKAGTIGKIREVRYHSLLGDYVKYLAPEEIPGDGTVPLESSTNLPINQENKYYVLGGEHGKMLSQEGTRQKIVNIISGSSLFEQGVITQDISECELNGRAISVYSPLSIDVVDQDGNHAGLTSDGVSIENNIPNADYEIMGEQKFVYLPTDGEQVYTINIAGTGTGVFTLTDASIIGNNTENMRVFNNIPVTSSLLGKVNLADDTTLSLDINGDEEIDQTVEPTAVLTAEQAQNFIPDQEEAQNISSDERHISSGGVLSLPVAHSPLGATEESQKVEQETIFDPLLPIKKQKKTESNFVFTTNQILPSPEESVLVASAINGGTQIDFRIVIGIFTVVFAILLIAKKFIKL